MLLGTPRFARVHVVLASLDNKGQRAWKSLVAPVKLSSSDLAALSEPDIGGTT